MVILGAIADAARSRLLHDFPETFAAPLFDTVPGAGGDSGSPAVIRLSAIKEISKRGQHAVLDVTPSTVERLNYAQFYPIVVFMRVESKHVVKEVRSQLAPLMPTGRGLKSSRKLLEHAARVEKTHAHVFSITIPVTAGGSDGWFRTLTEAIERQQSQAIWTAEAKPDSLITDDFLFPSQPNRLSYASSPESDIELANEHQNEDSYAIGKYRIG